MPQKPAIQRHPRYKEIIHDLVTGELSIRAIAAKYDVSKSTVLRFKKSMGERVTKVAEVQFQNTAAHIVNELGELIVTCRKIRRAYDRALTDPENPDEYNVVDSKLPDGMVRAVMATNKQLELALKLNESVRDSQKNMVTKSDVATLARIVLEELKDHKELRDRVIERIRSEITT
jgi:hypothetical protein